MDGLQNTLSVNTLTQLNRECLTIDLSKVRLKKGHYEYSYFEKGKSDKGFHPDKPLDKYYFNQDSDAIHSFLKVIKPSRGSRSNWGQSFFCHPSKLWVRGKDTPKDSPYYDGTYSVTFVGGKRGRSFSYHDYFTNTEILIGKNDKILGVLY